MHCTVTGPGQLIVGGDVSCRVMTCGKLVTFPAQSVAVQVRWIEPVALHAVSPLVSSANVTLTVPQSSVAVAVPVAVGSVG